MDSQAVFTACARERRAVADLLESLDERQLATPSLCAGWDVRTVAAHLAAGPAATRGGLVLVVGFQLMTAPGRRISSEGSPTAHGT